MTQKEPSLDTFIESLVEEKGITGVDQDVMNQIKADLRQRVEDMINAEIVARMPEYALDDFEKMLDSGSEADTQAFAQKHIPDLEEVVASTLLKIRDTYLRPMDTHVM